MVHGPHPLFPFLSFPLACELRCFTRTSAALVQTPRRRPSFLAQHPWALRLQHLPHPGFALSPAGSPRSAAVSTPPRARGPHVGSSHGAVGRHHRRQKLDRTENQAKMARGWRHQQQQQIRLTLMRRCWPTSMGTATAAATGDTGQCARCSPDRHRRHTWSHPHRCHC